MRGTQVMSASSLTGIALSYSIVDYMRGLFTPGVAQSIKMGELIQGNRRALLFWAGVSVLLGLGASVFYTLHLGYSHGAYNFPRFPFLAAIQKASTDHPDHDAHAQSTRRRAHGLFCNRSGPDGVVDLFALPIPGLALASNRTHPIGSRQYGPPRHARLYCLACKSIIMAVGGVTLYRRSKPAFLGLLVGYTAGVVLSFLIDALWWPGEGHLVHYW